MNTSSISRRVWVIRCRRPSRGSGSAGSVTSTRSRSSRCSSSRAASCSARCSIAASSALRASLAALPVAARSAAGSSATLAQQVRQLGLAAEVLNADVLERVAVAGGGDRLLGLAPGCPRFGRSFGRHPTAQLVQGDRGRHRRVEGVGVDRDVRDVVGLRNDLLRQPVTLGADQERGPDGVGANKYVA